VPVFLAAEKALPELPLTRSWGKTAVAQGNLFRNQIIQGPFFVPALAPAAV